MLLEAIEDAGFEGEVLQQADSNTITLRIEGMTCGSCSSAVETALRSQKGVVAAAVNLLAKRAEVHTDTSDSLRSMPACTSCVLLSHFMSCPCVDLWSAACTVVLARVQSAVTCLFSKA